MHSSIQKLSCKLLVKHQHILLTSQGSSCIKRSMQTIWTIWFFYIVFTAFTVKYYHILHHLKAGNQQKNLLPVCKLIILIPCDNISFQSWRNMFRTSVVSTPLTRCLFGTNCWILSCWLYYVRGSPIGLVGCGIWHIFAVICVIWAEKRGGKQEFQLWAGAGSCVLMGLGCRIRKGNRAG